MKKILILAIVIIILIFSYNKYQNYRRFNGPKTNYKTKSVIDINYHNKDVLFNYQSAISTLNSFVNMQWCVYRIDIINPTKDTKQIQLALNTYAQKLAKIIYYENILIQSSQLKSIGFNNKDISLFEETGLNLNAYNKLQKKKSHLQKIRNNYNNKPIAMGEKSPLIFEIQKLLNKNGFTVKNDGVYQIETSNAIRAFETKHNLFPDGKLDTISLEYLLEAN